MDDVLYFAYGSNLLRERLLPRSPNLAFEGRALLADHRLTFDKVSTDMSGKCAFEASAGEVVQGVLWRIPRGDLMALDRHEGVGNGYERCVMPVTREGGEPAQAVTYRATQAQRGRQAYDWYLALVIAGASQQSLPVNYVAGLRDTPFRVDGETHRKSRLDAIEALSAAGMLGVLLAL